jgi:hypothetical protein
VPKEALIEQLKMYESKIEEFKKHCPEKSDLTEAVARLICNVSGVSYQVIAKRIEKEKIHL